ncbi:hypothetical protein WOLCODRAFT_161678 [Wolfiporia cocos MD-104 SS10]|uniref:Uncharacterized protein n=1 Tax=Wolfiporia cocos (strain MD-104) TaxID=742152 RepID=A0A2H3J9I3_WOLCO|nr:hypothetical protein WOLCODRAFT_161678 [Wolfiporia cocos MD-104 SS10]
MAKGGIAAPGTPGSSGAVETARARVSVLSTQSRRTDALTRRSMLAEHRGLISEAAFRMLLHYNRVVIRMAVPPLIWTPESTVHPIRRPPRLAWKSTRIVLPRWNPLDSAKIVHKPRRAACRLPTCALLGLQASPPPLARGHSDHAPIVVRCLVCARKWAASFAHLLHHSPSRRRYAATLTNVGFPSRCLVFPAIEDGRLPPEATLRYLTALLHGFSSYLLQARRVLLSTARAATTASPAKNRSASDPIEARKAR